MDQTTQDALIKWKEHRYRPVEIPFEDAVRSLGTENELVEARQSVTRKSDWVLCRPGTSTPAIFVYAGVFSEADPYETGNLVWGKAPIPDCLDESRVTQYAGYKAAYSFAIETYHDKDIWELQSLMDSYIQSVPGFNSRGVPRREWQNGSTWHIRYWFRTPMFLTCEARGGRPDPPEGLHEWVAAAHRKSKTYRANPTRPTVCGLEDGRLELIGNCMPNKLEYGDVVSLVFGITYVEDREDWGPVPMLSHIIRVQHANRDVYQLTYSLAAVGVDDEAGTLPIGTVVDVEQAAKADVRKGKRAVPSLAGSDTRGSYRPPPHAVEGVIGSPPRGRRIEREVVKAELREDSNGYALLDDIAEDSEDEDVAAQLDEEGAGTVGVEEGSASEMDVDDDSSVLSYIVLEAASQRIRDPDEESLSGSTLTEASDGEDSLPVVDNGKDRKGRPTGDATGGARHTPVRSGRRAGRGKNRRRGRGAK